MILSLSKSGNNDRAWPRAEVGGASVMNYSVMLGSVGVGGGLTCVGGDLDPVAVYDSQWADPRHQHCVLI